MADRWGNDPMQAWWARWRRPVLTGVLLIVVLGQWDRLTSGHPFRIVTALLFIGFLGWMLFTPNAPEPHRRGEEEAWRHHGRRTFLGAAVWTAVASAWLAAGAVLYDLQPANFLVLVLPVLLAFSSYVAWRRPDRLAQAHRATHHNS